MSDQIITEAVVREMGIRQTDFGWVLYIQIHHITDRRMTWSEICAVFNDRYPGHWAVQMFPPANQVVDEVNCYHLFVLPPHFNSSGLNIKRF